VKKVSFFRACLCFLGLGTHLFAGSAVAPAPLQDYCPVVIVNHTKQDPSELFLVATALDPNGVPCFLVPDPSTGICSYQYPNPNGSNGSVPNSVALDSLPLASGTGLTPAYLLYLPLNSSARAYFSVKNPLFLGTTYSAAKGMLAINSPSITSLNDPNIYTLYQDFEFGVNQSAVNSSTNIFINVSFVDYFCIPYRLSANSYTGAAVDPTITGTSSGLPSGTTRASVISNLQSGLNTYSSSWAYLPFNYYPNPYTSSQSAGPIRILAAKNSTGLSSGRLFNGGLGAYNYFPTDYLQNTSTGPSAGNSYMDTVYNYYLSNAPLWAIITPATGYILYKMVSDSTTQGQLNFFAYTPDGSSAIPADDTNVNLNQIGLADFLSGNITFAGGFGNDTPIGAELGKLLSSLFTIGQLPFTQYATSQSSPFYNSGNLLIDDQSEGYITLSYFSNPSGISGGPWYNLYDAIIHPQELGAGALPKNPSLGLGYAFDYDDLLQMDGTISGITIQDAYGNPSQVAGAAKPYIVMVLENLEGTVIPDLSDSYYYNVTIGAAPDGASVTFTYSGGSTAAPLTGTAASFLLNGGAPISSGSSDYLHATFSYAGINYVFNVNLLGQVVIPTTGGTYSTSAPTFSAADVQYAENFTFQVNGGSGTLADPINITINFNSAPPPWQG